ncbi:integrase [Psychrobium sp. 1_MG-2023]|uniref:integrase n=1 Tax=Psychrobium sp. 1_MG-2023 TaxID=3062624 RepID=UPI000C348DDD|nr:integrase [Psychrobium sp. 1_MG-2023]MDP2562139.1 hypothetical protein [Psychrobium sp. 1_MG-2023]PKF57184.1 integrase [Alteromonadales bacterium alter-6D02]
MDNVNDCRVFDGKKSKFGTPPDSYFCTEGRHPSPSFVLCRDKDGKATAVYGQDIWNYNPYRLSAVKISRFRFDKLLQGEFKAERRMLVDEAKYLLFCIQFFSQGGHAGTLTASTLGNYYSIFRNAIEFCISLNKNQFIGIITLKDLFTNKNYLANFLTVKSGKSFKVRARAICKRLSYIGQDKVGFAAVSRLRISVKKSQQTPVIPTRLYLALISQLTNDVEFLDGKFDKLANFLSEFNDCNYGRAYSTQKGKKVRLRDLRPNMQEALLSYGLDSNFIDDFYVDNASKLITALKMIQYRMRLVLHLYTGMRDQEVMRLSYQCLCNKTITEEFKDDEGVTIVKKRIVKLISTTTKFTGYRESESWYAAPEAVKAIRILQLIARGLAKLYGVETKGCDLFLNPSVISKPGAQVSIVDFKKIKDKKSWIKELTILQEDFNELQASDPSRDFHLDEEFQIGSIWPIRSHQFRRSLAFYAASSGFVKLPTLKRQFKHLTLAMARYYSRNFENIKTIFGFYNKETKEFDLPSEHIIWECQAGVVTSVADMLVDDVLNSKQQLHGKTGGYIERQRGKLRDGEILIEEVRAETLRRVDKGELSYRNTLLGGCMKVGKCDSAMLGVITECLPCDEAIIKASKVDSQIEELKEQLSYFEEGEGEHQIMSAELAALVKYKKHRMSHNETEELI